MSSHLGEGDAQPVPRSRRRARPDRRCRRGGYVYSPRRERRRPGRNSWNDIRRGSWRRFGRDGQAHCRSHPGEAVGPTRQEPTAELARAHAERDAAVAALDKQGRRDRKGGRTRRALGGVLVALFAILLPITYVVAWTHNVVLNHERLRTHRGAHRPRSSRHGGGGRSHNRPDVHQPEPSADRSRHAAAESRVPGLALTNGRRGYVQDGVTKALQSSQFQALWKQATLFAYQQLLSVLNGDSKAVTTTNGQLVLNLVPLFNAASQNMQGFISGVVDKPIKLPTNSGNELPASARRSPRR
jgi:hypothetical protein